MMKPPKVPQLGQLRTTRAPKRAPGPLTKRVMVCGAYICVYMLVGWLSVCCEDAWEEMAMR